MFFPLIRFNESKIVGYVNFSRPSVAFQATVGRSPLRGACFMGLRDVADEHGWSIGAFRTL